MKQPVQLRPDYAGAYTTPPAVQLATAAVLTFAEKGFLDAIIAREYPELKTRAAATIASTSTMTAFAQTGAAEYIGALAPASAGLAALKADGAISLKLGNNAALNVAAVLASASGSGFVLEGNAIPVRQYTIANSELSLRKFCGISVFNREVLQYSRPSIEKVIRAAMAADMFLAFDNLMLDSNAETTTRPAGLRNGISANGIGVSVLTSLDDAMAADLKTVIGAVSAVANNGPIIVIASTKQAVALKLSRIGNAYPVYSTSGLADGTIMAIATNCLISAIDAMPNFSVSGDGTLHMEDTTPLAIGTAGSPNVTAAPSINLFNSDKFALRCTFDVAYTLRSGTGLSWLSGVSW